MNKPIIIDGVDVSECAFFHNMLYGEPATICSCFKDMYGCDTDCSLNINAKNCYYKQLQRLKAENEGLKAFKRECLKPVYFPDIEPEVINKYKQALEEVKRLLTIAMDKETVSYLHFELIEKSIKEINEVLKDE